MRVLVVTDSIGALTSAQAGAAIADGWPGAEVAVVPMGEAGRGFVQAVADLLGQELVSGMLDGRMVSLVSTEQTLVVSAETAARDASSIDGPTTIDGTAGSADLGRALRTALEDRATPPATIMIDLAAAQAHDGGAGLLGALGATADRPLDHGVDGLVGLTRVDLDPVRALLGDVELIGVVPDDQTGQSLLGLRGITSLRGLDSGDEQGRLLEIDATLQAFAELAGPDALQVSGVGACGGTGFAIAALGGRILSGPDVITRLGGLDDTVPRSDLVVTGCSVFDFAGRGGGVVARATALAGEALRPCIVVAGEVLIGGREMRTMGVESAYAVRESSLDAPTGGDITGLELTETVQRIARTWCW